MPADQIAALAAVVLVTVTGNSATSKLPFDNDAQCLMVRSLALTGLTPAEVKTQRENVQRAREAEQKQRAAEDAKWAADHPLRQPKNDDEQKSVDECIADRKVSKPYYGGFTFPAFRVTDQCVVQDVMLVHSTSMTMNWAQSYRSDQQFVSYEGPTPEVKPLSDVKSAFCIRADGTEVPVLQ